MTLELINLAFAFRTEITQSWKKLPQTKLWGWVEFYLGFLCMYFFFEIPIFFHVIEGLLVHAGTINSK